MQPSLRYLVEIEAGGSQGRIHQGNPAQARPLLGLQLGPDATVRIKGKAYPLQALVQALIGYGEEDLNIAYDERGQLELGHYLYAQLFGSLDPGERQRLRDARVEVRIVTQDEHIARLPWVLLAEKGVFLSTAGWSVALASATTGRPCELPPSPKILVVAPQPVGEPATKAELHLEKLEELLSGADPRHIRGRNLRVALTWEEFIQAVTDFQPHIVYYYGHGIGDLYTSRLVFATGKGRARLDKPITDLAVCLRQMPGGPPLLVYLNCCHGDAGGLLGAGWALGNDVPAVVTNRTIAYIDAAQAQGLAFWRRVLLDGAPPHTALAEIHQHLAALDLSLHDVRWMTPVLHCHYTTWKANPPQPRNRLERDPQWRLKLDRVRQFGEVFFLTSQMLQAQRPRSLAYVWYGQEGQGVELFHQRLTVELREKLPSVFLSEVLPEWPLELENPARSFADMLTEAFRVNTLEDIPAAIRTHNRGASGRQTLVYVRHLPVHSAKVVNPRTLKSYLEWWNSHFVSLLEGQVFAVLGISFVVGKPDKFYESLTQRERINDLYLSATVVRLLDELERVGKKDLPDFLHTHNIALPPGRIDRVLDAILTRTQGHYAMTLEEMKDIADRAWALAEETPGTPVTPEEYEYN